jgi:hypothetical protein
MPGWHLSLALNPFGRLVIVEPASVKRTQNACSRSRRGEVKDGDLIFGTFSISTSNIYFIKYFHLGRIVEFSLDYRCHGIFIGSEVLPVRVFSNSSYPGFRFYVSRPVGIVNATHITCESAISRLLLSFVYPHPHY